MQRDTWHTAAGMQRLQRSVACRSTASKRRKSWCRCGSDDPVLVQMWQALAVVAWLARRRDAAGRIHQMQRTSARPCNLRPRPCALATCTLATCTLAHAPSPMRPRNLRPRPCALAHAPSPMRPRNLRPRPCALATCTLAHALPSTQDSSHSRRSLSCTDLPDSRAMQRCAAQREAAVHDGEVSRRPRRQRHARVRLDEPHAQAVRARMQHDLVPALHGAHCMRRECVAVAAFMVRVRSHNKGMNAAARCSQEWRMLPTQGHSLCATAQ
jgi:hypothetical protein